MINIFSLVHGHRPRGGGTFLSHFLLCKEPKCVKNVPPAISPQKRGSECKGGGTPGARSEKSLVKCCFGLGNTPPAGGTPGGTLSFRWEKQHSAKKKFSQITLRYSLAVMAKSVARDGWGVVRYAVRYCTRVRHPNNENPQYVHDMSVRGHRTKIFSKPAGQSYRSYILSYENKT